MHIEMDGSTPVQGSNSAASPCGLYVASISNGKLRICDTQAPERHSEFNIRVQAKEITRLRWDGNSSRICILSARSIEVVDLDASNHRVRLDNGTGGLGRFVTADFIGEDHLLVTWEFGRSKLWNLQDGKGVEFGDLKTTCPGEKWQLRPQASGNGRRTLTTLSRTGAEDVLGIHSPSSQGTLSANKLSSVDAQCLSWSPDGRWLAILDTPTAAPGVHLYTPDGHHYRSYPPQSEEDTPSLSYKALCWSQNSQVLALTTFDGKIDLLNTRTFTPLAVIEHTTTIDQQTLPEPQRAPIWQEAVSATSIRSYTASPQPVSPPLSRAKPSTEPSELGVAEIKSSADGSYLATRDERMLNTVWIWNMATLTAHAVVIQHSSVRRMHWHPSRVDLLMLDCAEGIVYLFDAASGRPPTSFATQMPNTSLLSFMHTAADALPAILVQSKTSFRMLYPEGRSEEANEPTPRQQRASADDTMTADAGDDSLFDLLSGRTPMHPKTEQSYTERVDVEMGAQEEDEGTVGMDDTFREKRTKRPPAVDPDPFDDSEIF